MRAAMAIAICVLCWCARPATAAESTLRLRVAWGGGAEKQWTGSIELAEGSLSELTALGIEADEPGSIYLSGNRVLIRQRSPRAYDGVDLLVTADVAGKLIVRLAPAGEEREAVPIEIPLDRLISQSYTCPVDEQANQLLVIRSPGDRLRTVFLRSSLVFAPGDTLQATLQPHLLGLPVNTPLRIKAQLTGPPGAKTWTKEFDAVTPPTEFEPSIGLPLEVKLPEPEGVYELTLTAINANLRDRLPWKRAVAERKVQLVVIGAKASRAPVADSQTLVRVVEIDPAKERSWERFAHLMSTNRKEPLGSGDAGRWDHPQLGPLVQLGPLSQNRPTAAQPGWEAYPLPVTNPGQPHILEIEYPSDVPQTLGISLIEPNAAGAVAPIGVDSGLYISDEDAAREPALLKHRIVFWPKTKTPVVLLTNRRTNSRAVYGKIRALAITGTRRRALGWPESSPAPLGRAFAKDAPAGGRLIAGYFERPLFTENFSAPESLDAFSHRSLDDWNTFYQGATRLVEYLNYAGYNGLMLTVLADGSTIYPSRRLEPTPRHDTGLFFASGQDPVRKDVLEMLFRLFDRDGLALVPAVQFTAPLVELERLRQAQETAPVGLEWLGSDGSSRAARSRIRQGLGPYYNPLDPRVQQAMLGVVSELVDRYSAHASFRGIGVQLSAEGYSQLAGADGSYDDQTIDRFQREAKVTVPGSGPSRFIERARFLNGQGSAQWLAWRADNITEIYRRMGQVVVGARKDARLYLAAGTLFDTTALRRTLHPALPRRTHIDDVLLSLGLRPQEFRDDSVVFLRTNLVEPMDSLAAHAVDMELNQAPEVDRLSSAGEPASLFYHEPQRLRLPAFDAKSPFGAANTFTWLVPQFAPSDLHNRERFIHSLATLDTGAMFDGGWLLTLGQEENVKELLSVYRELPAGRFEKIAGETQPMVIRQRVEEEQTFVYLANDSPWTVNVQLAIAMPANCPVERLGLPTGSATLVNGPDGAKWTLTLGPYELIGARFGSPAVRLEKPQVTVSGNVEAALERRIRDLSARAAALASPAPYTALENPQFELVATEGAVPGWTLTEREGSSYAIDTEHHRSGERSLRVTNEKSLATLRSNYFPSPQTGRMSLSAWLRVEDSQTQPALRLALEGRNETTPYYRFAAVGGQGTGTVPLSSEWSQFVFQVDDLPADGSSELCVRLDVVGAGQVWIDKVELFDLAFSPNERVELTKLIGLADLKLKTGQLTDCARLLDGYWPHFLVAHVPLTQTTAPVVEKPRPAPKPPAETAKKPGMWDQMRGYVPHWR